MQAKLRDSLTCAICLGLVKDPRLLPCHHSFCRKCIDRLISASAAAAAPPDSLCPSCRAPFRIHSARMLPVDFTKNSLCEALAQSDGGVKQADGGVKQADGGVKGRRTPKTGMAGGGEQQDAAHAPQKQQRRQQQQLEHASAVRADDRPSPAPRATLPREVQPPSNPQQQQQLQQLPSWSSGLFSCGPNTSFAALACCCPCVASGLLYERLQQFATVLFKPPFSTPLSARRSMVAIETGIRPQSCLHICSAFVCYACAMAQESRELDSYLLQQQQELKQQQQQQQQKQPRGRNSMPISTDFVIDISKQKRQQARAKSAGWSSGLFDCLGTQPTSHPHSSFYGLVCPCYLSSHSMNAVTGVPCLLSLLCPTLCFGRTIIRSQLDLPGSSFDDLCVSVACLPCATCQEARQVQSLNGPFDLQLGQCLFILFCGCIICFANS